MIRPAALLSCLLALAGTALAEPVKIVAFGGSNTFGKNVGRDEAYPAQLERLLKAAGFDVVVVNDGTSGQTTADELDKVDGVIAEAPRIVIFQPGGNDQRSNRKHGPVTNTHENIQAIVRKLLDAHVLVLFSGNGERRDDVASFGIPTLGEINQLAPGELQSDDEHLTPAGYRMAAEKMLPQVEELLAKAAAR